MLPYELFTLPGSPQKQDDVLAGIKAWLLAGKEEDHRITFVQEQTFTLPSDFPPNTYCWYICVGWFLGGTQEDEVAHQVYWHDWKGVRANQIVNLATLAEVASILKYEAVPEPDREPDAPYIATMNLEEQSLHLRIQDTMIMRCGKYIKGFWTGTVSALQVRDPHQKGICPVCQQAALRQLCQS